jgi:glycosyltransferase involved in cell wall biosynthesis
MKIAFFNDLVYAYATGSPSAVGGAERQQWLLARGLAAAGWKVAVGVRHGLELNHRVLIESVEFIGVGPQFLRSWYRFLAVERPDWCYWRCASHLLGPFVAIARIMGVRTIFAVAFDRDIKIRDALFWRARWWPLYALGLLWTDRIFVQNEKQLSGLPQRFRAKASVVPSITPETNLINPHGVRGNYVAWISMFRRSKRPDLLVEIARKAPEIKFVVCGGATTFTATVEYGNEIADRLRALPNVEYRGKVGPAEALQVITEAALFVSTSDEEGFPNTFLQAWAAGTPVVSLTVDPDRIIERNGLGKVSGTIEQVIDDLRRLLSSDAEREIISERAREYVRVNHSAPGVVKLFENRTLRRPHRFAVPSHTTQPL